MNGKELFLRTWDREFQTTVKVLKAYPRDKFDQKPHERSRTARERAWMFFADEDVVQKILVGEIDLRSAAPPPPEMREEILASYKSRHKEAFEKMTRLSELEFSKMLSFVTGVGHHVQMGQSDVFWSILMDEVHRRGQLTIYLRLAGG